MDTIARCLLVCVSIVACNNETRGDPTFGTSVTVGTTMTSTNATGESTASAASSSGGGESSTGSSSSGSSGADESSSSSGSSTVTATTTATTTMTTGMSTTNGDMCDQFCNGCTCPSDMCTMCCAQNNQVDACQGGKCFCF